MRHKTVVMTGMEWAWVLERLEEGSSLWTRIVDQLPDDDFTEDETEHEVDLTVTEAAEIGE